MQNSSKAQEGRLIGALLRVPFLTVVKRIYAGLIAAGFDDLTYAHLAVFRHIDEKHGSRLVDLADEAQMSKQAMSYLVEQLEEYGYLRRVSDPDDGRARLIFPTERGEAILSKAREIVLGVESEWADHLGIERMNELRNTLKELVTMLESRKVSRPNGSNGYGG